MVGELIADRYELEELVGTGGMSSVYRARDRLLERQVAIKILHEHYSRDESYVERFRREARAAAKLSHPNIVTVIDRGEAGGRQYIVFEFVDGQNLKQLISGRGRLPVRDALELGIEIGRALAFAHAQGLVHRDVKPQNVLLGNGDVKVTDFGIARSLDVNIGLTQTGTVLGTSEYLSPEQATGRQVDARTDEYSLGVVLYELLAGEPPYTGDSLVAVAMRHLNDPVPSISLARPDVPLRVDAALQRAMAKDPDDRFQSMSDFVVELGDCLAGLGDQDAERTVISAPAVKPRARPVRRRRRFPAVVALLVLIAAVGVGAATYYLVRDSGSGGGGGGGGGTQVHLVASNAYDPHGDGQEHDEEVANATDGNVSTYWETERYDSVDFGGLKDGVGIVVDAGRAVKLGSLSIVSDTPGYMARIEAGASSNGPFNAVSPSQTVGSRTTFSLSVDQPQRYYLVWITRLAPGYARTHVNEVTTPG
jgi:eukaryotic-like serine/threonine-protein kinase